MKKTLLLILCLLCSIAPVVSSPMAPDIDGVVSDTEGSPIPYANVLLLSKSDSSFVQGVMADSAGHFRIETSSASGFLKVSALGYEQLFAEISNATPAQLQLAKQVSILDDVEVKAQMPKSRLKGASMITSIEGTILSKSGTLLDMLGKVPGIIQNKDGFEVIGRGTPVFYVNGRKVKDTKELKRINSDEIQDIEVIQNPGAQYDATVMAVVRIRTKKNPGDGFGFDITTEYQQNLRRANGVYSPELDIHYRHNNLELFGELAYWCNKYNEYNQIDQQGFIAQNGVMKAIVQNGSWDTDWDAGGAEYALGSNYQLSENHSVGIRLAYDQVMKDKTFATMDVNLFNNDVFENRVQSRSVETVKTPYNLQGNVFYNGQIGNLGVELNADYFEVHQSTGSDILESNGLIDEHVTSLNKCKDRMWAAKLLLDYPLWGGDLQFGSEASIVNRNNTYNAVNASIPSSLSDIKEKNLSSFISYSFEWEKVGQFSVGARYEHIGFWYSDALNPAGDIDRTTDKVYPSVSWSSKLGPIQTGLTFCYKTVRPAYWQLNDAITYMNSYTLKQGNSNLQNEYIQSTNLSLQWSWLTLNAFYSRMENLFVDWAYLYNEAGTILMRTKNLEDPQRYFTFYLSGSPTVGIWTPYWTLGMQQFDIRQDVSDPREKDGMRSVRFHKPFRFGSLYNYFSLPNEWQLEVNLEYKMKGDLQMKRYLSNYYDFSVFVQKCWLKDDALCLRVGMQDILKKANQDTELDCGYYTNRQRIRSDSHRLYFTLRYTFNATDKSYNGTGAGNDIKQRMVKEK